MSQEELSKSPEGTIHPYIWYLLSTSYAVGFAFRPRAQKWTRHSYCPKISSQFYRRPAKKSILWHVTLWSHVTGCFENRKGPLTLWGLILPGHWGLVAKSCPTLATPWTVACQVPLSMGFSRPEYWMGLLFPSPGDLPNPGIEPGSLALQVDSLLIKL